MNDDFLTDHPDLDKLFEKLRQDQTSLVFAPLADACRKAGRIQEALEICSKGTAQHPGYASGHVVLGKCHYDNRDMDKAAESFNTVLSLDVILAERGEAKAAREHFRHILALDPENAQIRSKLEHIQLDLSEAEKPVSTIDPDDLIDLNTISEKEFEGKTISLSQAEETSDELATLTLADIYASQGYTSKALKIYREILKDHPDNPQAREKLTAMESLPDPDSPAGETEEPPPEALGEEPDLEMEELSEDEENQRIASQRGGGTDRPNPAGSEYGDPDVHADEGGESTAPSKPAPLAEDKPADASSKSIDEQSAKQHFQDWLRRMSR
jgi:tetratricopeptide (TPR) repeat protein